MDLFVPALGWALLHFVWQGLAIGAVAAVALALLRRAEARQRYAVCALALLACLALPAAHLAWLLADPAARSSEALPPAWLLALGAQLPALVSAWSLGVGLMSLRLGLGLAWVARLRRRAEPVPPAWQARLDALARRLGLSRPVPLRLAAGLDAPITLGSWRPLVLLPAALLTRLPLPLLEALLAHELAHVRRWDYLANLLQSLVEALLFFHPVVWWLSGRLRDEREQVADALAARALDDPRRLALALQALAEVEPADNEQQPAEPELALSARGGRLLNRIEHLMSMMTLIPKPSSRTPAAGWKLALPAVALAAASLLVQAARQPADPALQQVSSASAAGSPHEHGGRVTPAPVADEPSPPATLGALMQLPVNARHMLVLDEDTGRVLMSKDAEAVVPIASLTKLVTAMVVLDARQPGAELLQIAAEDVDRLKHSASRLRVGARMSREAALELALVSSDNRAAAALARAYPGGTAGFERAVQAKLRSLGLSRTRIVEPTGLSPANVSTAAEMARIAAAAARYPAIARITSESSTRVAVDGRPRELRNTNRLVGGKGWDIRLSKTGYTEEAGRCLAMRVRLGAKELRNVMVVLLDADGSAQRLADARRIRQTLTKLPEAG
jgi:D-alanyl-D-alanine endopeptidase (penicillin-binding protein 7)